MKYLQRSAVGKTGANFSLDYPVIYHATPYKAEHGNERLNIFHQMRVPGEPGSDTKKQVFAE